MAQSKYSTTSEIDKPLNVFASFRRDAAHTKAASADSIKAINGPVLTISSLGHLGRFGNQLFQYAFLRICANKIGAKVQCPPWIGQKLFGHDDEPISCRLPPAIERGEFGESLFDIIPEFVPYLEKLADAKSCRVGSEAIEQGLANVDLWGFFQLPTHLLESHKAYFRSLFQPVQELRSPLDEALRVIRSKGKTVIGIHIRRGDFITEPRPGFALVFPAKWYREWLDSLWNKLKDPVLYVCSDDLNSILPEFESFSPITWRDLEVQLPASIRDLGIEFYIDFFILSKCDVVCSSNSNFSFVACMLNERGKLFVRPHWDFSTKFVRFDPWNSRPVLWFGGEPSKFRKRWRDVLQITYVTQGFAAMLRSMLIDYPRSLFKLFGLRLYLGYQIQGGTGVIKSLLHTLGWRSAWRTPEP